MQNITERARHLWRNKLSELRKWQKILLRVVVTLLLSAVILLLTIRIQPNDFSFMLSQFATQPLLIVLNFMPIFLLMVFFETLTGNVFFGAALTDLLVGGLSVASRIKCFTRQEPLYPRDLHLLREAAEAITSYHIDYPMKIIAVILVFAAVLFALGFMFRRYEKKTLRGLSRWLHFAGSIVVTLILIFTVYSSHSLYISFHGTNFFQPLGAYNGLGFPYSFCNYLTTNSVDKPKDFYEAEAAAWDNEDLGEITSKPVNVVIVMNETFSDIVDDDAFTYSEADDPISFFHSMTEREDVLSGHLVVMNLGGGTANTEFDVMTGIETASLSSGTTVAYRAIDSNKDSIFRMYSAAGYQTSYIHPGYGWFYNRNHIMPWFGVDSMTFIGDLEDPEILGSNVSDDYTADLVISQFEADTADGGLAFNYTTTIQNHMNYTLEKYGEDYPIPALQCSAELDEETETALAVYIEGLRYADASLEKLVTYFESCGEPVLFAFFGDHLPYLGAENSGYWQLGMEGDNKEYDFSLYEPPYFIWANDQAKEILDWDNVTEELELPEFMSACYFGATLMEITGTSDNSPWFSFVNETRRELPVVWADEYVDCLGNVLYELNDEQTARMDQWRKWAYYRLQCKKVSD